MNHRILGPGAFAAVVFVSSLNAAWTLIFDGEDSAISDDESVLESRGWVFQDFDFAGVEDCVGEIDCTGVRKIVQAPYHGGRGNAISIRATDPAVVGATNLRSISAFGFGDGIEIPRGGTATVYLRFALEGPRVAHTFGFTTVTDPVAGSPLPRHGYNDLGPTTQVAWHEPGGRTTLAASDLLSFNPWWSMMADVGVLEPGVWYELWYQITNVEIEGSGGGYFELFVRGGAWGDGPEPVHLANPRYENLGFTDWEFRHKKDAPIVRFLNIANGGFSGVGNGRTNGAIYFDDLYVSVGEPTVLAPFAQWPDAGESTRANPEFGTLWGIQDRFGEGWFWSSFYGYVWVGRYGECRYLWIPPGGAGATGGWYYYWGESRGYHFLWSPAFAAEAGGESAQGWCVIGASSKGFFYLPLNASYSGGNFKTGEVFPKE